MLSKKKKKKKKENSDYGLTDVENRLVVAKEEREEGFADAGLTNKQGSAAEHRELCSISRDKTVMEKNTRKNIQTCTYVREPRYCTAEIDTTLQINETSME